MSIEKWKPTPERLTARSIRPRKEVIKVEIKQTVELPDELKLIIFIGLVSTMVWMMLTTYIVSFAKPDVIIIQGTERTR